MNVIRVDDLSIKFNIKFLTERMTIRRFVPMLYHSIFSRRNGEEGHVSLTTSFWALKNINFTVKKGEVVGLIGHNGAGKSTLLMTLAGIYQPNRGTLETEGSIGSLLSLGAGFNDELTGRENIILNYLFMGIRRREIDGLIDQVVDFAELDKFIDAPLKTYSSGMRTRLGFSIAINLDPDIVLLDEVMEAGDAAFRAKAGNLLHHFKEKGKTIVLASHRLQSIKETCDRALLLDHGAVVADGDVDSVIGEYQAIVNKPKV